MLSNIPAFVALVLARSPLKPEQFDSMLCASDASIVASETKALAWQILQLKPHAQYEIWLAFCASKNAFPDAKVSAIG